MKTARRLDLARILPLLRCPATGAELNITPSGRLVTADGEHSYPILDGVPALIDPSKSLFASEAASGDDANGGRETPRARANRALWALGRRVVPSVSLNVRADRNLRAFGRLLTAGDGSRPKRLLIVAGAIEGTGVGELPTTLASSASRPTWSSARALRSSPTHTTCPSPTASSTASSARGC